MLRDATFPDDFCLTDAITDKAIDTIAQTPDDEPFFLYLAYTAPHWLLRLGQFKLVRLEARPCRRFSLILIWVPSFAPLIGGQALDNFTRQLRTRIVKSGLL